MEIQLSGGRIAFIDDCDWELVRNLKWRASFGKTRTTPYVQTYIEFPWGKNTTTLHRLIMGLEPGDDREVDHINHNGLDNRRNNLRIVTRQQQAMNMSKQRRKLTSKYKGVYKSRNKWKANGKIYGKTKYLGTFYTEEEAAIAYNRWALDRFGEYACINDLS